MAITHQIILGPIIGGLSHDRVKIWARADGPVTLYVWIGKKSNLSDASLIGTSGLLVAEDGYVGIVTITQLQSKTQYHYALTLTKTKPKPSKVPYPSFITFPPLGERYPFSFVFGSCFRPSSANGGGIFHAIDVQRQVDDLRFILMLGDQIYADQWQYNNLGHIAITIHDYRDVYAYTWSRPPFRNLLKNIPVFMILDDHEVDNDWHWNDKTRRLASIPFYEKFLRWIKHRPKDELFLSLHRVRDALKAYWEHQGIHGPDSIHPMMMDSNGRYNFCKSKGSLAYKFSFGAAAFFIMDTRTNRIKEGRTNRILDDEQWIELEHWLLEDKFPLKFLVSSSSILFDMLGDFTRDRWNGFKLERNRLLNFIAKHAIENLYILTGDLHAGHAIEACLNDPTCPPLRLWEFCASPFEQAVNNLTWTRIKTQSQAIKGYKLHFIVTAHNYGVVNVSYSPNGKPIIHFSLHGSNGNKIRSIETK